MGITLTATHEACRDEADTWLMARDAPLSSISTILGRAGTPALWYAMLIPLAIARPFAGDPPIAFALLFALFVNATVHAFLIGALIGPIFGWQFRVPKRYGAIVIMAVAEAISGIPMLLARQRHDRSARARAGGRFYHSSAQ